MSLRHIGPLAAYHALHVTNDEKDEDFDGVGLPSAHEAHRAARVTHEGPGIGDLLLFAPRTGDILTEMISAGSKK